MAWDRQYLENFVKDAFGLSRNKEDGLLTDAVFDDALADAMKKVADDCGLNPALARLPLRDGQWSYPMPEDCNRVIAVYYIDDDGTYRELRYIPSRNILNGRDPDDDDAEDPLYFSYPVLQGHVFQVYAKAPDVYDFVPSSYVTTASRRTVIDSGINLGRTWSGRRVKPGDIVRNLTDGSYGYVEVLDVDTAKVSGTADAGTDSDTVQDDSENFTTSLVAVDDVVCVVSGGIVVTYGFVTAVGTTTFTYSDVYGDAKVIEAGDSYRVGVAQKIRLDASAPHRGLREGANNYFSVSSSALATITGTTFTPTSVTGSSTSGATAGDTAIASGGSHGYISAVDDNSLTVDKWIGGIPAAGETVTVKACDKYQVEDNQNTERCMWIRPTPSESDTIGSESMVFLYERQPAVPTEPDDVIPIPERYADPLKECLRWQCADRMGPTYSSAEVQALKAVYRGTVSSFKGDVSRPPLNHIITAWGNRHPTGTWGVKNQAPSGNRYDISDFI